MLSLFKLPFGDRNRRSENCLPLKNINFDIWNNFMSRRENISAGRRVHTREMMDSRRDSLQQSLTGKSPQEQYELMNQYLRDLDNELQNL